MEKLGRYGLIFFAFSIHSGFSQSTNSGGSMDKLKVIIFMAIDCPITQKYIPTMNGIVGQFSRQNIEFIAYFPSGITATERRRFRKEYDISKRIKLISDGDHIWTNFYNALVTPECFLVAHGKVVYRGAIDNWFFDLGRYRTEVTDHFLINAIEVSLTDRVSGVKRTKAFGCFIQRFEDHLENQHH
jgi:thiol-disulfide isomerase/thioredoxin